MALSAKDCFEAGDLAGAIEAQNAEVKRHPADVARRGFLAELLAFTGQLERADKMLDVLGKQAPEAAMGISVFRQLVRGEQARHQCFTEGRVPEFLKEPPPHLQLYLQAGVLLREGKPDEAVKVLAEAEEARPHPRGVCNGREFDDLRDIDDLTAGFFEVITSTGKYFWVPIEDVEFVEFRKPERARDIGWRRAHMIVSGGTDGEVFMPAIYPPDGTEPDDRARLGRFTDWAGGDGAPVRGIGQRTFLVGEDSLPILEIEKIEFAES
jgi:type VI secretion system protein ImpE